MLYLTICLILCFIIPCFYNAYGFNLNTWRSTWLFGAFLLRLAAADNPAGDHSVPHKPPTATSHLSVISPPNPVDNILMDMRLWTWQKQGFDLRDKKTEVKIFENSHFLNDTSIDEVKRNRHRNVYNKLCETLETDQFHWYSTIEDEAKHKESCRQWSDRNCVLWEVKVPVGSEAFRRVWKVRRVCSIAWVCLLKEFSIPTQLRSDWKRLSGNDKSLKKKYKQDFHDFWKGKSEKELWDALVLEKCVDGCTDILLRHPLDDSWIEKNPIKEEKWWKPLNPNDYRTQLHNSPLPCDGCSCRGASKICSGQTRETMNETTVRVNEPVAS